MAQISDPLGIADLHVHTEHSDGQDSPAAVVNGLLFAPGSATSATDGVRSLLRDAALREAVRVAGRLAIDDWSWRAAVTDLRGWYRRAIEMETIAAAA